ncbi:MAG: adenylate/guanylate cyclase domain-containing protein, partial [Methylococcaceae bacterium]|nr:adenylate/guanylate cyclase domain-containing protein [Methylococcaceae bacterium]
EPAELGAYDWLIRLQPKLTRLSPRIALITIGESDLRRLGHWPISDLFLARTVERLAGYGPRAIGIDIYRDVSVSPGKEELDRAFIRHRHIVATMKFGNVGEQGVPPPPVLGNTDQVGFSDVLIDSGGMVRRGMLFLDGGDDFAYSFALRLAMLYLERNGIKPEPDPVNPLHLRLGPTTIAPLEANEGGYVDADVRGYQFLLDFRDTPESIPRFSLAELLDGRIASEALREKIVLIGVSAVSVNDFFCTPLNCRGLGSQETPGVVLQAQVVSQLLRFALDGDRPLASLEQWQEELWILLWSLAGGVLGRFGRSPARFSCLTTVGLLLIGAVVYLAFLARVWIPLVTPALSWLLSLSLQTAHAANQERRQRAALMDLFARYVDADIAREIWEHRGVLLAAGRPRPQRLTATILFSDLSGFTTLAEKIPPEALMEWLNEYLQAITPLVTAHGGVVIRFIGDAMLAGFGVPVAHGAEVEVRRDAVNAIECALAMENKLIELNRNWQARGLPFIGMRVGVNTGPVVAGSIGGSQRLEYAVHGDTVNIAARLESYEKDEFMPDAVGQPCRILFSEWTLPHLDQRFRTKRVGQVNLRGKEAPVVIYQMLGYRRRPAGSSNDGCPEVQEANTHSPLPPG